LPNGWAVGPRWRFLLHHAGLDLDGIRVMCFYMQTDAVGWFMLCAVLLGLGGANFAVTHSGCPNSTEQSAAPAHLPLSRILDRFAAAGFTFLVGAGIRHFQNHGHACRAHRSGLHSRDRACCLLGEETKGKCCPLDAPPIVETWLATNRSVSTTILLPTPEFFAPRESCHGPEASEIFFRPNVPVEWHAAHAVDHGDTTVNFRLGVKTEKRNSGRDQGSRIVRYAHSRDRG